MLTRRAGIDGPRSGHKPPHDPYFTASTDRRSVVVLREGVNTRASWESVAESLVESSEDWIVSQLRGIQHPAFFLDLGFRHHSNLLSEHSLHLYAVAFADRIKELSGIQFNGVRLSKRHGNSTTVAIGEALPTARPLGSTIVTMTTRRSYATPAFGQEVQEATHSLRKIMVPNVPLGLHVSYLTGLPRTWSRLWVPTISGLFALQSQSKKTDSAQIVELGFHHLSIGEQLGHRVQLTISASQIPSER